MRDYTKLYNRRACSISIPRVYINTTREPSVIGTYGNTIVKTVDTKDQVKKNYLQVYTLNYCRPENSCYQHSSFALQCIHDQVENSMITTYKGLICWILVKNFYVKQLHRRSAVRLQMSAMTFFEIYNNLSSMTNSKHYHGLYLQQQKQQR